MFVGPCIYSPQRVTVEKPFRLFYPVELAPDSVLKIPRKHSPPPKRGPERTERPHSGTGIGISVVELVYKRRVTSPTMARKRCDWSGIRDFCQPRPRVILLRLALELQRG